MEDATKDAVTCADCGATLVGWTHEVNAHDQHVWRRDEVVRGRRFALEVGRSVDPYGALYRWKVSRRPGHSIGGAAKNIYDAVGTMFDPRAEFEDEPCSMLEAWAKSDEAAGIPEEVAA